MPQFLQDILFISLVAVCFVALFRLLGGAIEWKEQQRGVKKSSVAHDQ